MSESKAKEEEELRKREKAVLEAEKVIAAKNEALVAQRCFELGIHTAEMDAASRIFVKVFQNYPAAIGKALAKREREETQEKPPIEFVYGEIQFFSFALTLGKIKQKFGGLPENNCKFADLGSGSGKAVLAAMLMHDFEEAVGIEILTSLHKLASEEISQIWEEVSEANSRQPRFIHGDFFEVCDWTDADVVFACSTCFSDSTMIRLSQIAERMKQGSFFITLTKKLPGTDAWEVIDHDRCLMSWGETSVFIQRRNPYF